VLRKVKEAKPPEQPIPVIVYEFPELSKLELLSLGDIHWDSVFCEKKLLKKKVQEIKDQGYYTGLIGDTFDKLFFNRQDREERDESLNEAFYELIDILEPIKDRILYIVRGNHDKGVEKATEFSITQDLARWLDVPYIKGMGIVHLRIGTRKSDKKRMVSYAMLVTHGWGGGRRKGSGARKIEELSSFVWGVDFYVIGHLHKPESAPRGVFIYDPRKEAVFQKDLRGVVLSSFQSYPIYAQEKGMNPGAKVEYLTIFNGYEKEIIIEERPMR